MRQDRGDAGADVVAANDRRLPDFDAGDVRDGVERAGRKDADGDAEVAETRAGFLRK